MNERGVANILILSGRGASSTIRPTPYPASIPGGLPFPDPSPLTTIHVRLPPFPSFLIIKISPADASPYRRGKPPTPIFN